MKIEIYPLEKVVFDTAEISFGMDKTDVEALIGKGQQIANRYYYFNNEVVIDYNGNKVEFIEFLGGVEGILKPVVYGVSVFDTNAQELIEVLKSNNNGEICDAERGYCYQFSNIGIGLYREAVPDEIVDMIEEAKSFGNPMSDDEIEYEMKRANYWATIGCGSVVYYQR